jgi:hypothetical protein
MCFAMLAALAAPVASAQSPTSREYDNTGLLGTIGDTGGGGNSGDVQAASAESGSLPFTGLDLAVVALLGVALVGTGFMIRRGSGPASTRS